MKITAVVSVFLCAFILAANPHGLRSYKQSVTLNFSTVQEAEKAVLVPRVLPKDYNLAFSSRWDDNAKGHINTFRIMKKYGAKGNFYLGGDVNFNNPVAKDIIRDGCLAGCHTVHHYPISLLCANEHFYEYMANRIGIEVATQNAVNTQASPFGQLYGVNPEGTESIGRALFATGITGFPDKSKPEDIRKIGYPDKSFAFMYRIVPGDRVPDMKKFERDFAAYMSGNALKNIPALAMSTHSWHTKEGLPLLDEIYRRLTSHKDWWNCNQNEYAAYRYEFDNVKVEKRCDGKSAHFTITRFEPFELGADVPLTLELNCAAVSANGAQLGSCGRKIELPHTAGHTLPEFYGYNNDKFGIKGVSLVLEKQQNKLTAVIVNKGSEPLEKCALTFRLPPDSRELVIRRDIEDIASGKETAVSAVQEKVKNSLHYVLGNPYYAVQFDFIRGGRRYRLYADLREQIALPAEPRTLNEAAAYFCDPENCDYAKLSLPQTDLKQMNLVPLKHIPVGCTEDAICPGTVLVRCRRLNAVIDFACDGEKEIVLPVKVMSSKDRSVWLNGKKLSGNKKHKVKLLNGRNRLVLNCPRGKSGAVALPLGNGIKLLKSSER